MIEASQNKTNCEGDSEWMTHGKLVMVEAACLDQSELFKMMRKVFGVQALPLGIVERPIEWVQGRKGGIFFVVF